MPSEIAPPAPSAVAFVLVLGIWLVSDWTIAYRRGRTTTESSDRGSKYAIGAAVVVGALGAAAASILVPSLALPGSTVVFWTGLAVILLGVAIRQSAVRTLGDAFTLEVTVEPGHEVVESGPYRWVRHPSYTGGLLSLVGVGVATGNALSVLIAVVAGLAGYGYRIRVEERALSETIEGYEEYAERTPYRLVPGIW